MAPASDFVNEWLRRFDILKKRRFFKFGVPFIILVFGGSFYLKQFASIRYVNINL